MRQPGKQARHLPEIFLEFADVEFTHRVGHFVIVVGIGMVSLEAPAPQVRGVLGAPGKGKVIEGCVQLRHDVTLESIPHVVWLVLHQISQVGKGEDRAFDVASRKLGKVYGQTRCNLWAVMAGVTERSLEHPLFGNNVNRMPRPGATPCSRLRPATARRPTGRSRWRWTW